jgi:hypothetical protein
MTTTEVLRALNLPDAARHAIFHRFRKGKLARPRKNSTGDFVWSRRDMAKARRALSDYSPGRPR